MRKITMFALLAAVLAVLPAVADTTVNQYVSADDVSTVLLIKYVGTSTSATVASASTASMTFQVSSAAYTGFECPVSGALGGIIDVTNASCNTLGEVVDTINGDCTGCASDFRAVIVDGLRTDSSAALLTVTTAQATLSAGVSIPSDTDANFAVGETRAVIPTHCRTDIRCWLTSAGKLLENPFGSTQTKLTWAEGYSTYGSGTSQLNIYTVKPSNKTSGSTESVTQLWNEDMGATTANKQFTQFQYVPLIAFPHEKMVVRITNSAAQASVRLLVAGTQVPVN